MVRTRNQWWVGCRSEALKNPVSHDTMIGNLELASPGLGAGMAATFVIKVAIAARMIEMVGNACIVELWSGGFVKRGDERR